MTEEWRDVPGWEGYYQVSSMGRVKSCARTIDRIDGTIWPIKERVLRASAGSNGYPSVQLSRDGRPRRFTVHRLVALAFLGDPGPGYEVCHNDGSRTNCSVENLRWDTHSANGHDLVSHGRHFQAKKTHCKRGHEFTEENTKYVKTGRECRACMPIHQASHAARLKAGVA